MKDFSGSPPIMRLLFQHLKFILHPDVFMLNRLEDRFILDAYLVAYSMEGYVE